MIVAHLPRMMNSLSLPSEAESVPSCAQSLRCIAQKLESLELKAVELKYQGGEYLVQGWHKGTTSSVDVEMRYPPDDIRRIEQEGKARRRAGKMADPFSLPEVFRFAGQYVDRICGRLIRVSWQYQSDKIQSITIQYDAGEIEGRDREGSKVTTIDEICIHIYKQRKKMHASSEKHAYRQSSN